MIEDFLGIGIVGAVLSVAFEYFKGKSNPTASKLWVAGLSAVLGAIYMLLRDTVWWQTMLGILAAASTVYALFMKNDK
jgi:hypothetical protein